MFLNKKNRNGFTLVEMLVSLSIVAVIMLTVLFNYSSFNDRLALSSAAQELAVSIRQAQTYGLTVREVKSNTGLFDKAYGVYFNKNDPSNYYLFVDSLLVDPANKKYDVGSGTCGSVTTECVEKLTLRNGVIISNVCNASTCSPGGSVVMNVSFTRPNPDANIIFTNNAGTTLSGPSLTGKVELTSPKGKKLTITIEGTGQILVGPII
jgi:prepilin-type N-terminal cleavage/methylation domain-containing protein